MNHLFGRREIAFSTVQVTNDCLSGPCCMAKAIGSCGALKRSRKTKMARASCQRFWQPVRSNAQTHLSICRTLEGLKEGNGVGASAPCDPVIVVVLRELVDLRG